MGNSNKIRIFAKRLAAFIIAGALLLAAAGCTQPAGNETLPSGTAKTTPATPTPEPKVGLEAVLGKKEITIDVISNADEAASKLFFDGAQAEADAMGVTLKLTAAGSGFDSAIQDAAKTADAVVACLMDKAQGYGAISGVADTGVPVCVFEMEKGNAPEGVSHIYYSPDGEVSLAFDAALKFPPHDTPVRLILMFESEETQSYKEYKKLYDEGKIFPKQVYIASEQEEAAGEWLTGKLESYVEGMIDGIYAENASLAFEALDALEALQRGDMEVFCPGVTAQTVARMEKNPDVFAQSAGANTYLAGALCVRAALKALKGEGAVTLLLEPSLITAAGLKDANALLYMGGELSELYNEDWMIELRSFYGADPE